MTSIPSFGTSLLQNAKANQVQSQSVEDILANTPSYTVPEQVPDSFTKTDGQPQAQKKGGFDWVSATATTLGALGLFFAGRKGWFGKHIQTWFGGRMSQAKVYKNIETKMTEYIGRDGDKVTSVKINTDSAGKKVLKAEFDDGTAREFFIDSNKDVIRLKSNDSALEEYILFNKKDGAPMSRVTRFVDGTGKVREYNAFKGEDILDKDFSESSGIYKSYQTSAPRRRYLFGLFGPKQVKTTTLTYTNPQTGQPNVTKTKTVFENGKKVKVEQNVNGKKQTLYFDESGKLSSIRKKDSNGKVYIEHYEYKITPEGKQVLSGVKYTDKKGNLITAPAA